MCGEKLETQPIEKIYNSGTTDSKGEAIVGGYLVTVTDTDTKNPIANAAVALRKDNSISIRLPNSRLLDYADQTTVTVQLLKDKSAVPDMSIAVTDKNDNYAADETNKAGQITVPTGSGKTNEDGKVTGGYEDADGDRWTLTVKVIRTDTKRPISGSEVSIGKTGNITVKLPDGTDLDAKHQVTVIVTDHKKNPQENKNITVKGDLNQTEKGKTDKNGELTVPEVEQTERHGVYIVGYANEDATQEQLDEAVHMSRCEELLRMLPLGYDTELTAAGANISQGQRQLPAIARAFVADPKILILDEATSNVDTRTEKAIQSAMQQAMRGRTSIVIAHRLSTIRDSDLIVVMDQGEIVESGDHDTLLAQKGKYYELYMTQYAGFEI